MPASTWPLSRASPYRTAVWIFSGPDLACVGLVFRTPLILMISRILFIRLFAYHNSLKIETLSHMLLMSFFVRLLLSSEEVLFQGSRWLLAVWSHRRLDWTVPIWFRICQFSWPVDHPSFVPESLWVRAHLTSKQADVIHTEYAVCCYDLSNLWVVKWHLWSTTPLVGCQGRMSMSLFVDGTSSSIHRLKHSVNIWSTIRELPLLLRDSENIDCNLNFLDVILKLIYYLWDS